MKLIVVLLIALTISQYIHNQNEVANLTNRLQIARDFQPKCKQCPDPIVCIPRIVTVEIPCPEYAPCPDTGFNLDDCKKRYWWLFNEDE